jgi:hypothetical protein
MQWVRPSSKFGHVPCGIDEVGAIFLSLLDTVSAVLWLNPGLQRTGRLPPEMSVLPKEYPFQSLLGWLAYLCRGEVTACRELTGTLVLYTYATQLSVHSGNADTGSCYFVFQWPSEELKVTLRPNVDVYLARENYIRVDNEKTAMDSVLVYLFASVRNALLDRIRRKTLG